MLPRTFTLTLLVSLVAFTVAAPSDRYGGDVDKKTLRIDDLDILSIDNLRASDIEKEEKVNLEVEAIKIDADKKKKVDKEELEIDDLDAISIDELEAKEIENDGGRDGEYGKKFGHGKDKFSYGKDY